MDYSSISHNSISISSSKEREIFSDTSLSSEQIEQYTNWFIEDAERNSILNDQKRIKAYKDESLQPTTINNQKIQLFAPFHPEFSALQTFTRGQICVFSGIVCGCLLGIFFFHIGMVVAIIAFVSVIYLTDLLITAVLATQTLNISAEEHIDDRLVNALVNVEWPRYTILCPLYHEVEVVPQFVRAMQKIDYPTNKLQILFLTEAEDTQTRMAIQSLHLPPHFSIITVPDGKPRTKPRACNYGLLYATGDYVVIFDAEDIPEPLQLKKAVLAFANRDEKTACVQAKLNFYNSAQNLLTRWFTAEYSLWFDLTLPGLQRLGVPLPLGGTSNHFRASTLRELGAWDAYNVTEDCDLGLRMAHYGYKTLVLDSTTYEEANSQFKNWLRQRSRWIKGYMQTYLVYMRHPQVYLHPERMGEFFSLQFFVGAKTGVLFINPFMWALVACYALLHPIELYHTLFPGPILYMGAMCLIFGNFFYTYSHLLGCMKRGHYHLVKWTLTIPIYWAMASIAAFIALQQLIFKPHYWEKTTHGLHLHKTNSMTKITVITEDAEAPEEIEQFVTILRAKGLSGALQTTTSLSSNISITDDDIEIEFTEKTVRLKMHVNAEHFVQLELFDDADFNETTATIRLPQLASKHWQKLLYTSSIRGMQQKETGSDLAETTSIRATTPVQLVLFEDKEQ